MLQLGFHALFCAGLVALLCALKWATGRGDSTSSSSIATSNGADSAPAPKFKIFQRNYLLVYLLVMAADWMQGPYVYALYTHYGFDMATIGLLFTVGFGTSAVFGTCVGSAADKYGRKTLCLVFGLLYGVSCVTKHYGDVATSVAGRVLSGVATSILHSAFESWMIAAHHKHGFKKEWLSHTFSLATTGNGIVAIASGIVASALRDQFGPVAPFDASLALLSLATLIVLVTWEENYGDRSSNVGAALWNACALLKNDRKILLLGIVQSCFESSMYIFVFLWTPALETRGHTSIPHGVIFSSFMVCVLIGSTIFGHLVKLGFKIEHFTAHMLAVACLALVLPAFTSNHVARLSAFCVFEACCGIYWPALGTMRSRYIPEEVRASVMNIFRLPLNLLVVSVLSKISEMEETSAYLLVGGFLCCGALVQVVLGRLIGAAAGVVDRPTAPSTSAPSAKSRSG